MGINIKKVKEDEINTLIGANTKIIQDIGLKILKSAESQEIVKEYLLN